MFLIFLLLSSAINWTRVGSKSPVFAPAQTAHDLFEEFFRWRLDSSPEFATLLGLEGYDHKLGQEINRKIFEIV